MTPPTSLKLTNYAARQVGRKYQTVLSVSQIKELEVSNHRYLQNKVTLHPEDPAQDVKNINSDCKFKLMGITAMISSALIIRKISDRGYISFNLYGSNIYPIRIIVKGSHEELFDAINQSTTHSSVSALCYQNVNGLEIYLCSVLGVNIRIEEFTHSEDNAYMEVNIPATDNTDEQNFTLRNNTEDIRLRSVASGPYCLTLSSDKYFDTTTTNNVLMLFSPRNPEKRNTRLGDKPTDAKRHKP